MNALGGEYLCLREISINVNKLLAVFLLSVYFLLFYSDVVVACLLLNALFYTAVVAIFLFIR